MQLYYTRKNKVNPIALFFGMIFATAIALVLTAFSALVGLWLGRPYVGIILVALSAYGSMVVYRGMLKATKTRHKTMAIVCIALASLLVSYMHMAVVISAVESIGIYLDEINPMIYIQSAKQILWDNIFVAAPNGEKGLFFRPTHLFGSFWFSGPAWIVYLFVIFISNMLFPQIATQVTLLPFSEKDKKWMTKVYSVGRLQLFLPEEADTIMTALENGSISPLLERSRCTRYNAEKYAKLYFYKIGNRHSGYMGVENFYHKRTKDNELSISDYRTQEFVPAIMIGEKKAQTLEASLNASAMMGFGVEDAIPNTSFHKIDSRNGQSSTPPKK